MGTAEMTRHPLSRRDALRLAGRAGAGALAFSLGGAGLRPRLGAAQPGAGGAREIHLEARELTWELAPGKALAYNGRIPGPELRVTEGERVRIVLRNALREPTTIHWHGLDVPATMDGVPGISQRPVQPGERFVLLPRTDPLRVIALVGAALER